MTTYMSTVAQKTQKLINFKQTRLLAINNCGTVRDDCHQYATCTNTGPGTHRYDCNAGYQGDGKIRCDR